MDTSILSMQLYWKDRSRHGGGVLLKFRQDLQVSHRADLDCFCNELLWMEIATLNGPFFVGVYCRSPSQSNSLIITLSQSYDVIIA